MSVSRLTSGEVRERMAVRALPDQPPAEWITASQRSDTPLHALTAASPDQSFLAHARYIASISQPPGPGPATAGLPLRSRPLTAGDRGWIAAVGVDAAAGPEFIAVEFDVDGERSMGRLLHRGPSFDDALAAARRAFQAQRKRGMATGSTDERPAAICALTRRGFAGAVAGAERAQQQLIQRAAQRIIDHIELHGLPRLTSS